MIWLKYVVYSFSDTLVSSMALSAAERAKKYRQNLKAQPLRHEQYLQKERERYRRRKAKGEFDLKQKTPRQQRQKRRYWTQNSVQLKIENFLFCEFKYLLLCL